MEKNRFLGRFQRGHPPAHVLLARPVRDLDRNKLGLDRVRTPSLQENEHGATMHGIFPPSLFQSHVQLLFLPVPRFMVPVYSVLRKIRREEKYRAVSLAR